MIVKIADTEDEFQQIHTLNHKTFAEEIPQHEVNSEKKLLDKFHGHNTYIIVKEEINVLAMLAFSITRPFSLEYKIPDLEKYLPPFESPVEIRLLSVVTEVRKSFVLYHLLNKLITELNKSTHDIALISGTTRELGLYHKIGFKDFAYPVGKPDALYQPMFLIKENVQSEFLKKCLNK